MAIRAFHGSEDDVVYILMDYLDEGEVADLTISPSDCEKDSKFTASIADEIGTVWGYGETRSQAALCALLEYLCQYPKTIIRSYILNAQEFWDHQPEQYLD